MTTPKPDTAPAPDVARREKPAGTPETAAPEIDTPAIDALAAELTGTALIETAVAGPEAPEPEAAAALVEEDDEASLPAAEELETPQLDLDEQATSLAAGREAIVQHAKLAPSRPGVYRMIDARGDVLYVGKAKNIRKRIAAYARPTSIRASSA
jgi:excinuclease ABC subunit C